MAYGSICVCDARYCAGKSGYQPTRVLRGVRYWHGMRCAKPGTDIVGICLRVSCAKPGTYIGGICLGACYAMSGTELAYGGTARDANDPLKGASSDFGESRGPVSPYSPAMRCPVSSQRYHPTRPPCNIRSAYNGSWRRSYPDPPPPAWYKIPYMVLRTRYEISGTDIGDAPITSLV
eukprot:3941188-Rhodomonas_salina.2